MISRLDLIKEKFSSKLLDANTSDCDVIKVSKDYFFDVCKTLKENNDLSFEMLTSITCVDYLGEEERFELVYHLYSLHCNHRLRIKVRVKEGDEKIISLCSLYKSANWFEREVYDMFGIKFLEHPDLRRLLLYEEFVGYPLRKDYPLKKEQPIVKYIK